jgi:hypothetical protein
MPCNCRKCDCSNRASCILIENRLKTLACIFDKVADGTISVNQRSILNFDTTGQTQPNLDIPVCSNYTLLNQHPVNNSGNNFTYENTFILYCGTNPTSYAAPEPAPVGTVSLFSNDQKLTPTNFIPQNSVANGQNFLSAVLCLPSVNPQNIYCLTCLPVPICVPAVCAVGGYSAQQSPSVAFNNLENYSAIAQNLRYAASILGCQYE